ncbi:YbfB/YjiJ family MFS transporter [Alcaligenaceae bacterium]|nr:YbfB/YjiJ family MFS transporter [Alcaligenaceae bacterium]
MQHQQPSAAQLAFSGMIALAVAMGIGRFAFTPLLPMMQQDAGLELAQAGWLAGANYLGYLVGAVAAGALPWSVATQLRVGLAGVAITTALMAIGDSWAAWATWRFIAGLGSAIVLVSTATLCMGRLAALGQSSKAGIVFAGVGGGIALAGLLCMGLALAHVSSSMAWLIMGFMALLGTVAARRLWASPASTTTSFLPSVPVPTASGTAKVPGPKAWADGVIVDGISGRGSAPRAASTSLDGTMVAHPHDEPGASDTALPMLQSPSEESAHNVLLRHWRMIVCYTSFGFGYILPATFLPAQARQLVSDPAIFGLAWPVFGIAAAVSTLLTSRLLQAFSRRKIWIVSQLIMAVGVLLPALWSSIAAIVIAALCVGGTLLVITMIGMQEAQARGGSHTRILTAAITAAFALGQLIGPIFFSVIHDWLGVSLNVALQLASAVLVVGVFFLLRPFPSASSRAAPSL